MELYSKYILPVVLDRLLSREGFSEQREQILQLVKGRILELGIGTGLNLLAYPKTVNEITTVDVNEGLNRYARKRAATKDIKLDHNLIKAEKLPFEDDVFDTIVCTWLFCSIPDIDKALKEMFRVLKLGGQLLFLEHGLNPDAQLRKRQHRWNPLSNMVFGGCHLNRDVRSIVEKSPFDLVSLEEFEIESVGRLVLHTYRGVLTKTSS